MFLKLSFLSQPYREIFEFFIDNFKTYKPLLSAIKNEYEATLGKLLDFDLLNIFKLSPIVSSPRIGAIRTAQQGAANKLEN